MNDRTEKKVGYFLIGVSKNFVFQSINQSLFVLFCFFFIAISYITLHTKITYYLQCQRNLQFNDNNKTYNTNIIYDFNILHYNLLISFM